MSTYPAKFYYKDDVAEQYDTVRKRSPRWNREIEIVCDAVSRFEEGTTVLDVAFGTGRFLHCYVEQNHPAIGVDISSDMLREARANVGPADAASAMLLGDAEKLPLANLSVDYLVCMRLLNWVPMAVLSRMVSEFQRVARRGLVLEIKVRRGMESMELLRRGFVDFLRVRPWLRRIYGFAMGKAGVLKGRSFDGRRVTAERDASERKPTLHIHDELELLHLFDGLGLSLEREYLVDTQVIYRARTTQPLSVYVLKR